MDAHDAAALRTCLYDIDFPATRGELLRAAIGDRLHPEVIDALAALPAAQYRSGFEVLRALSAMEVPSSETVDATTSRRESVASAR
jgi:hypothetical protein